MEMPEPKKRIEELLEASAQMRRAQFGDEPRMPNPMRARLHEEIARQNRGDERSPRRSWLARFWRQISLATAAAAALAIGALVWMKSSQSSGELQLATNAPPTASEDAASVLRSLPAAPKVAQAEAEPRVDALTSAAKVQGGVPLAAAPAPPADQARGGLTSQAQQFAQRARGQMLRNQANQQQSTRGVLDRFEVEQEGQRIRLVDADGSIYTGELTPEKTNETRARTMAPAAARILAKKSSADGVAFRASGFNNRLQQNVVVEGNYIAPPPNEQKDGQAQNSSAARIIGTAQVAGEAPLTVDAVSIEP